MGTFNSFAASIVSRIAGSVPVWLGTSVIPAAVGGVLEDGFNGEGVFYPAGTPVLLHDDKIRPFLPWKVLAVDTTNHVITVADNLGHIPAADDFLGIFDGKSFKTATAVGKVASVAANATAGWDITMTDDELDGVTAGQYLAATAETAVAASGKSIIAPNGYLYNDIRIDKAYGRISVSNADASGAVVKSHAPGILINRTPGADYKDALLEAIPNVIQDEH